MKLLPVSQVKVLRIGEKKRKIQKGGVFPIAAIVSAVALLALDLIRKIFWKEIQKWKIKQK